ncbi:hypothetical protein ACFL5L_00590 [candidate division KSB1 bacterium]
MIIPIADQLRDGSCLLISGQTTAAPTALTSAPTTTALTSAPTTTALTPAAKTTAATAINKTALTTGAGLGAALGLGTVAVTILGVLVVGLVAYGVNKAVKVYIA